MMDIWKKVFGSELLISRQGTYNRPYSLITKLLKLKYCSRSSLALVSPKKATQKIIEHAMKVKIWKITGPLPDE